MIRTRWFFYLLFFVLVSLVSSQLLAAASCGADYSSARNNYGGIHNASYHYSATSFAALKADGSIPKWEVGERVEPTDKGYVSIVPNVNSFAALKSDGSISAWGPKNGGGSGAPTGTGYVSIASTGFAFAALKANGSITAWGDSDEGGSGEPTDSGYVSIASNSNTFAALKSDGSISAWGYLGVAGTPKDSGYVSISGVGPDTPTDCVFRLDSSKNLPVADNQLIETTKNTAIDVTLTGSDPENAPITFALVDEPINGGLSGAIPALTYTPNINYTGSDSFSFTTRAGIRSSGAATVSIMVNEKTGTAVAGDGSGGGSLGYLSLTLFFISLTRKLFRSSSLDIHAQLSR